MQRATGFPRPTEVGYCSIFLPIRSTMGLCEWLISWSPTVDGFSFINKLKKVGALFEDLECGSDGYLSLSPYTSICPWILETRSSSYFALTPLCDLRLVPFPWPKFSSFSCPDSVALALRSSWVQTLKYVPLWIFSYTPDWKIYTWLQQDMTEISFLPFSVLSLWRSNN